LGGIGKTQTAVEYAYRYRDKYKAVLWLNAGSPLSLKTGCGDIARRMPLPHDEKDLDQAAAAVKYWLGTHSDWLLILDYADDPAVLVEFLPTDHKGHILITSRAQDFQLLGIFDPVELRKLPIEDATAFLLRRCGREGAHEAERGAARELAGELDGLPLALEQAAAYIVATRAPFQCYLESYRTGGLAQLEEHRPALGQYPSSVATTWAGNFAKVQSESEAAADVLRLSAFLAPDAIPFELLTRGASQLGSALEVALSRAVGDPLVVNHVLQAPGRFSLIRIDGETKTFGIHQMVQVVLKVEMDDASRRLWAERAVRAVNQAFPDVEDANWPDCDRLLPHALAAHGWIESEHLRIPEAPRLLHEAGWFLHVRARYAQAEPLFRGALAIREATLGREGRETAISLNHLALLFWAQGRYGEAEPLFRRALAIREATLSREQRETAISLNNLALLFRSQGRYGEAEPLFRRALAIREATLPREDRETANTLNDLARLLHDQGRHAEAEPLYKQAMEINPNSATPRDNLAGLYRAMGRHAEAEPLCKEAMEIRRKRRGERHPNYATSLNSLAELYRAMGRHAEAEPLCKEAMEIRRMALGERHPDYAASLNNLALLYDAMGRHAEAEPLYKQAMEINRTALGEQHPNYATSLNSLAALYYAMGRHAEAEPLYKQAMEIYRTVLGERHPNHATSLNNLAELYRAMGHHSEAEPLYKQAMEIRRTALGERHPDYAQSLNNLALLYDSMGRQAEAEELRKKAMEIHGRPEGNGLQPGQ